MCISRKGPWIQTLLAVPSPTTPLGDAALHSKLSLRLGMVTHAKRSVYIIHFKCIASLSHLDFGTSPSIQLCPDLTTCRTETQGFFILAQLELRDNHYFQSCRIAYQVSWGCITILYIIRIMCLQLLACLKPRFITFNTIVLL